MTPHPKTPWALLLLGLALLTSQAQASPLQGRPSTPALETGRGKAGPYEVGKPGAGEVGAPAVECFVIGDSIAVGIAAQRPECRARARVGIRYRSWFDEIMARSPDHVLPSSVGTLIISLGSNDDAHAPDGVRASLERIRALVSATRVVWVLPATKPPLQAVVRSVAARHGDRLVAFEAGADGVHPTGEGYRHLAAATR